MVLSAVLNGVLLYFLISSEDNFSHEMAELRIIVDWGHIFEDLLRCIRKSI